MKTKMSAAQREARREAGLSTTNPTHACSGALRTPNQTAKRSVTRISDPKRKMKGNELDPDTQLEKRTFAAIAASAASWLGAGFSAVVLIG